MSLRRIILVLAVSLGLAGTHLSAEELKGVYLGLDEADGARIEINADRLGYTGTFYDAAGKSQGFKADRVGDAAEAVLDMDNRTVVMQMVPLPFGAVVALVPIGEDGAADLSQRLVVGFRHESMDLPQASEDYVPPPETSTRTLAANSFLASYQFWAPNDVARGYLAMPERFQTIFKMFSAVQLDVIWKLCLADNANEALATALRGQGVTCRDVVPTIARTQNDGRFGDYKRTVLDESRDLRLVVRCADNYAESKETCDRAAKITARAATSLKTAATALGRYR